MIKILKIKKMLPTRTFDGKDNNGNPRQVVVKPMVLTDGINSIMAEAVGDAAAACANCNVQEGDLCTFKLTSEARAWKDQNGTERWENRVNIQCLNVLVKN